MANFKYDRVAENLKVEISRIFDEDIDDIGFVSVIHVEITKDLGDAKVYLNTLDMREDKILKILNSKKAFIKKKVAMKVKIRRMPDLIFKFDHSLDNYNSIENILSTIK